MTMLATELAGRGLRVAHIVHPVENDPGLENPTLIQRPPWSGRGRRNVLREAWAVWSGLRRANAASYIVRGSGGYVIVAAAFCTLHRRPLVFSTSNDLDFDFDRDDRRPLVLGIYRRAIGLARRMVVQTEHQRDLARASGWEPTVIPSFGEPAERTNGQPRHFLWANRLVDYKRPREFLELAEAVPEAQLPHDRRRTPARRPPSSPITCGARRSGCPTSSCIRPGRARSCTRRWRTRLRWSPPRAWRGCRTCSSRRGPAGSRCSR